MNLTFQFRRGSAAEWTLSNRVLLAAEPGVETDTGKLKIGNGVTGWNALPYLSGGGDLTAYYTKTEIDTMLGSYATDAEVAALLATYATDAEVAALLATYTTDAELAAALANYYLKTETYTKAEVDALTGGGNPWEFMVEDYGALGNGKMISDVGVTNGSGVLTSAGGNFTGAAVGQWVMVNTSDGSLRGQITNIASAPGQVTIDVTSTITESGLNAVFGTDDVAAINAAISAARTYAEANGYYAEILLKDKIYIAAARTKAGDTYANWNTQIKILPPTANNGQKLVLKLKGVGRTDHLFYWNALKPALAGSVIVSMLYDTTGLDVTYGWPSVIGSPVPNTGMAGTTTPTFVNHKPLVEDLMVVLPYKSGTTGIDLSYSSGCYLDGISVACFAQALYGNGVKLNDWWSTFTGWEMGIRTPVAGSNADTTFGHLAFEGINGGLQAASEHVTGGSIKAIYMGVVIPIKQGGVGHGLTIDRVTAEAYQGGVSNIDSTANVIPINIGLWVTENPGPAYDFHDLGGAFRGRVHFIDATGARAPIVDGCAKFRVINDALGLAESPNIVTLTDAATIAIDANLGNDFRVTLGGNRTLGAPTNPTNGQRILIQVKQDATGSRTLGYNAAFSFGAGSAPVLSTAANKVDLLAFVYNSVLAKWLYMGSSLGF